MKKIKIIHIILLVCLLFTMPVAYGDMGPKPTIDLEIKGIDEPYSVDLLAPFGEDRVIVLDNEEIVNQTENMYYKDDYPIVLNGYYQDGFAAYSLYEGIPHYITNDESTPHHYHFGYFSPPSVFKVVVVKASGDILISETVHKQLFNASIIFDLSEFSEAEALSTTYQGHTVYYDIATVSEDLHLSNTLLQIVVTVLGTLIIEGIVLVLFGYRKKQSYLRVLMVNLATQIVLYTVLSFSALRAGFFGYFGFLILGEIVVFTIEIIAYKKMLTEKNKNTALLYALVANFASMIIGLFWIFPMFM